MDGANFDYSGLGASGKGREAWNEIRVSVRNETGGSSKDGESTRDLIYLGRTAPTVRCIALGRRRRVRWIGKVGYQWAT